MKPNQIIVALDFAKKDEAFQLLKTLDPNLCAVKIGLEMFTAFGSAFVKEVDSLGYKIFLDLKFHDIPNTVARACVAASKLNVWMLTLHAAGGQAMLEAAKNAVEPLGRSRPLLVAVTVLTSMDSSELARIGCAQSIDAQVKSLANLASLAGMDGVVCSALESSQIKEQNTRLLTVTPGIRLDRVKNDDQVRIATPEEAIQKGSDFLVIGRPITRSENPRAVLETVLSRIQ